MHYLYIAFQNLCANEHIWNTFDLRGLTLIPARIRDYILYKVWNEIT